MKSALSLLFFLAAASSLARSQEPAHFLNELDQKLRFGDIVQVTNLRGEKIQGKVLQVSGSSLALESGRNRMDFSGDAILEIRKRKKDPWWNGALIGGGIGVAAGLIAARNECGGNDSECSAIAIPVFVLPGIGIGAAAGALIDRSIRKLEIVFTSVAPPSSTAIRISPVLSREGKGVRLTVSF